MSIVAGLFRQVAPGLIDNLEAQGLFKGVTRSTPSLTPEMFIGGEGISNLGKAGLVDADSLLATKARAEQDRGLMSPAEWDKEYGAVGLSYDPTAEKAMFEISDRNVDFQKGIDINTLTNKDYYGFDEIFKAPTLKKSYPEIADVKILMKDDTQNTALAAFDPENNTIQFNRKSPAWDSSDPLGTTLHEIQHYVQQREGLTGGESFRGVLNSNPLFTDTYKTLEQKINQSSPDIIRFLKQNPRSGFDVDSIIEATQFLKQRNGLTIEKALERGFNSKSLATKFKKMVDAKNDDGSLKFQNLNDILFLKDINSAAYNTAAGDYMRVAGETFARQTEQRRLLSPEERLATPAMQAIDDDRINKLYNINTTNLTPPRAQATQQEAFADPFAMQVPQSTIPEGM
jgi:hypothetical protein